MKKKRLLCLQSDWIELNWTYFIVFTNTKGLDTSSDNLTIWLKSDLYLRYGIEDLITPH